MSSPAADSVMEPGNPYAQRYVSLLRCYEQLAAELDGESDPDRITPAHPPGRPHRGASALAGPPFEQRPPGKR